MFDLAPFHRNLLEKRGEDLFGSFINNFFNEDFLPQSFFNSSSFSLDVKEDENSYIIEADIPGVNKEAINIEYENNYLTISAKRDDSVEESKDNYIRKERHYGEFRRAVYIDNIDENKISASFKDGVLNITLPKLVKDNVNKRKIQIN